MTERRTLTIPAEIDLASRAIRGAMAYSLLGYQDASAAPISPAANPYQNAVISQNTVGTHIVIPGASGQQIEVHEIFWFSEVDQDLDWLDGSVSLTGLLKAWPAQGGTWWPFTGEPKWTLSAGNALRLSMSAVGQVSGYVKYRMVP